MPETTERSESSLLPSVVVLTALEKEYDAVRAFLSEIVEDVHPTGTVYEVGLYPRDAPAWRVVIAELGANNTPAAAAAERAIAQYSPRYAFFVGVAGGRKDVRVGDVVCASKVYAYHSGKDTQDGFRPRPIALRPSAALLERARAEKKRWNRRAHGVAGFRVHEGAIAAGEVVVASGQSATAEFLAKNYGDALAIEMEGAGFLEGAHQSGVDALVIRGISDLLDGKSASDATGSQERASQNAAAVAFSILEALARSSRPR